MKRPDRLPVADQIRKGLEECIRHTKGEITLKSTTVSAPDPPPAVLAGEVAELRAGARLSQDDFARVLNVSIKTVQKWENGTSKPSSAALRLIQVFRDDPKGLLHIAGMNRTSARTLPTAPRPDARP